MTRRNHARIIGELLPVITITVLFFVILLLVVFSAVSYHGTADQRENNDNIRSVLTYVVTSVKTGGTGEVQITERNGSPVLALADEGTGYEQQIYCEEGTIYAAYVQKGAVPKEEEAVAIGETLVFEPEWQEADLLRIRTDEGTSYVRIRGNG